MSDNVVATFFANESLLNVSMGQDGLLGYFASNYSTIIAMYEAIYEQEEKTLDKKRQAYKELKDLRDNLAYLDDVKNKRRLDDIERGEYREINLKIKDNETKLEEEDVVFFKGEPLRMCAEYEFIDKVEGRFPGMMLAMLEIDQQLRRPLSNSIAKLLSVTTLPLRSIAGWIIRNTNLGVAGNLLYMLIDQYPELIKQRMQSEVPTGRPVDYPDYKVEGYVIKEIKHETSIKHKREIERKDGDD